MTDIFIADDHPMILAALKTLLEGTEFEIAGNATSGEAALAAISKSPVSILLADVQMPGMNGIELVKACRRDSKVEKIVLLTAGIGDAALLEALEAGVDGIVLKNSDPAFLIDCLETVRQGGVWIDPELREKIDELQTGAQNRPGLAPRERVMIRLVRRGLRNREIAEQLGITEGTVKVYLHAIYDKLGVANRTELAIRASEFISSQDS